MGRLTEALREKILAVLPVMVQFCDVFLASTKKQEPGAWKPGIKYLS
jgi:hypothetical protein